MIILWILLLLSLFVNQGYVYAGDIKGKVLIQGGKGVKDAVVYMRYRGENFRRQANLL
ncbi:hypothetical protein JGI15_10132 [Candidatus Kryptonium thompsonii]|nr:hypothetical protein JGI15_10132 [Candidatus Kryptonium thompsoni]